MLGCTKILNLAYDNCDFKFRVSQPMDLKDHSFESITISLFFKAHESIFPEHLKYAMATWEHHPNNADSVNPLPPMTLTDVLPTNDTIQKLEEHCQWHIKTILVEKYFPQLRLKLGSPQSTFTLCRC